MISIQAPRTGVAELCAPILGSVPEWFGIEEANQHYLDYVDQNPTFVAMKEDVAVGFLAIEQHFSQSAEIYVMSVHRDYHRQGIGRMLVDAAQAHLRANGTQFLQVKTLSDHHPDAGYAKTRAFYLSIGFVPFEEFPTLWGEQNPALQLVKFLG